MSKLYLSARTDMSKTEKTARGNKHIEALLGYDQNNYNKKIEVVLTRFDDDIQLNIADNGIALMVCNGTIKDGIEKCRPSTMKSIDETIWFNELK